MAGVKELFLQDSIHKKLILAYDEEIITNSAIYSEEFELTEGICTNYELRFGRCEASSIKVKIVNSYPALKNKWLLASMELEGVDEPLIIGKYKVDSDKLTADRRYRDIVAYDSMYDIINADVTDWYNTILPNADSTVTLKEFRDSFLTYFSIEQEEITLINDSMIVEKTIEPSKLSGKTVITAICEINGCFGHIGRDGKFQYIFLKEMIDGLYPSDTLYPREDLFPRDAVNVEQIKKSHYISAKYEDFVTEKIDKLQIRQEEDDIGCIYGTGTNCYIVQDNFLVYGKSTDELNSIAANLYSVIQHVSYQPAHVEAKGNPCIEVGAGIRLATTNGIIRTYILQRTLKGIQALRDTYDAEGEQYQRTDVNSPHESLIQLKAKTNKLSRTLEETRSEIASVERKLDKNYSTTEQMNSAITQRADSITLEVNKQISETRIYAADASEEARKKAEENAASDATSKAYAALEAANNNTSEVLKSYSTTEQMNSAITAKANEITLSVSEIYSTKVEVSNAKADAISEAATDATNKANSALSSANSNTAEKLKSYSTTTEMNSAITAKANEITLSVSEIYETKTDSTSKHDELSARITVNADNILLKVSKGEVSSQISQESDKITIKSNRFSLEATNCTIAEDGTISAKNVDLTGKITASSGSIGGFEIGQFSLHTSNKTSLSSTWNGVYVGTDGISLGQSFKVTADGNIDIGYQSNINVGGAINFTNINYASIKFANTSLISFDNYKTTFEKDIVLSSGDLTVSLGDIIMSGATSYIRGSSTLTNHIKFETSRVSILNTYSVIGKSGGYVGFFGSDGSTKKTISSITSTSNATASANASKINEIITALKAYNLIG